MDGMANRDAGGSASSGESHAFVVDRGERPGRLDRFLADKLRESGLSREKVKELIREGRVTVDGCPADSPRREIFPGSEVRVDLPARVSALEPEAGELSVFYRDAELAVLNKPAGLTVHPAPGLTTGTLAHRLVAHFPELAAQEGFRPGIVHRLDKNTSGLMLAALTERCRLALADMFARHAVYKEYLALVRGVPRGSGGVIDAPMGRHPTQKTKMAVVARGKAAKSAWRTLYADPRGRFALVAVRIYSGRTHQVRVHMAHIGHPLWGDAVYGGGEPLLAPPASGSGRSRKGKAGGSGKEARAEKTLANASRGVPGPVGTALSEEFSVRHEGEAGAYSPPIRQMLHAWKLGFVHPFPGAMAHPAVFGPEARRVDWPEGEGLLFRCPPPPDFAEVARFLGRETLRVAVTGSPGCGKSSLLEIWRRTGMPVFSADAEVGRLYGKDGDGQRLLRARFGVRFVPDAAGPVDKAALGPAMRDDPLLRREVEALIHPLVRHAVREFWREQEARGMAVAAAEIPLYLETGFGRAGETNFDSASEEAAHVLVGVHCPFSLRRQRLMQRRGWGGETIDLMESWQWPEDRKMAACDRVIDNSGTEADLERRAGELTAWLVALRGERESLALARLRAIWDADEREILLG